MNTIKINNNEIVISSKNQQDYISLTDMARCKEGDLKPDVVISRWLRTQSTLEFLTEWELLYNPDFKPAFYSRFKNRDILNVSLSQWTAKTNAIGVYSKKGRYGGTYAHEDIALEFATAISPRFKLQVLSEYKHLKRASQTTTTLTPRYTCKQNYKIQRAAIRDVLIANSNIPGNLVHFQYAQEADLINQLTCNKTAKQWKQENPELSKKGKNMRDYISETDQLIMSNLEVVNGFLIGLKVDRDKRRELLEDCLSDQVKALN